MMTELRILAIAGLALLSAAAAPAQEPPKVRPILRLETGMHTAPIRAAAVDAAGGMLVTVSDDRTARLWSLSTGELIRVLRPEIGPGAEERLFTVAMSPDARFVVTGGSTGFEPEKGSSFYLFETATGRLVRRISGLPEAVNRLAWSPDGRYVAAGLLGANGIRLFETKEWREVSRDTDYTGAVYGLGFDVSGRLAAAAFDGNIRLYNPTLQPIAKAKATGGARPETVAFSPNGSALAVGYADTLNVDIFSVSELRRIAPANVSGLAGGNLGQVAWAADGTLLAGGTHWSAATGSPIFHWTDSRWAKRTTLAAADGTVMGIVALGDGGFVYVTADPAIGRYDARQTRILHSEPSTADLRGQIEKLRLSSDGAHVAFGLEKGGRKPVWFDADARMLNTASAPGDMVSADAASLPVRGWQNQSAPTLAGKPLALEKDETSRSLAIAPDRQSFVLGTEWYVRCFGSDGKEIWRERVPSPVWAVDISGDGRLAVAALGNGTIRWYRYKDGKRLLTLFPDHDGRRWVLFTPSGFYDASPAGEDLIGWHVNRGSDKAADWFPASRFRDQFYRPAAVGAVLRTLDLEEALSQTASRAEWKTPPPLPPIVTILSPREGEEVSGSTVEVRYVVRSPSGEKVTGVQVQIDGRPLEGERGAVRLEDGPAAPGAEREGSVVVPLERDGTISLIARAGERAGEAANVKVIWKGERPHTAPNGKLYLLAVGVSAYRDDSLKLRYSAKDAAGVVAAFKQQEGGLYREVVPKPLLDEGATRDAILKGLAWLEETTTPHDVAMVFLAGHGMNDKFGEYYFLAQDSDPNNLKMTGLPNSELAKTLSRVAGKALFFFDTCHSGSVSVSGAAGLPDINGVANALSSDENGLVVFAASTGREFAVERDEWGHGAFSEALIEALTGKADPGFYRNGRITVNFLDSWLEERVSKLTRDQQHPISVRPRAVRDFAVAEEK
jgi:WD40 repeat protein